MRRSVQTLLTVLCGLGLAGGLATGVPWLAYAAVAFGAVFALESAWASIRSRELDVNLLMVLAAIGAVLVGAPLDAAALLFLFSLSNTLEQYAMAKTGSAIAGLIKLRPDRATRVDEAGDVVVPVAELRVGDRIRIKSFEAIPVDGEVESGVTHVDEAAMTGESIPVRKEAGDRLLAGTQNLEGMLVMRVAAEVGTSTLDRVVELVRDAQENKASGERISQWFGQRYTIFVVVAFAVSFAVRLVLGQQLNDALYGALTLLVALSPCALVISTPATTLSALAWAGRRGILIRGGEFLERLGKVKVAALDKTGTLTTGKPRLVELCVCSPSPAGGLCREDNACWHGSGLPSPEASAMLRAAAAAEQYSSHPIAQAIVEAARSLGVDVPETLGQQDHQGLGVTATLDGVPIKIGQRRFFDALPDAFDKHAGEMRERGMTVAIMEFGGSYAALGLRDEPRPNVAETLTELRRNGIDRIVILTGDNEQTARAIAGELGLSEIYAGLMPEDKTRIITEIEDSGTPTLMVGDGINDAPSLSRASVGIAMGGLGSDITLNAADVVIMQDRIERLPELLRLGRRTTRVIRANLVFAASVIVGLTFASLFSRLPLPLAVIGHEGSTVLVILNGLRLLHNR